jgi:hypothetical protein
MRIESIGIMRGCVLSTAVMLVAVTGLASAASPCKGLEESACAASSDCRWQAGYTRKDGIEVKSHCRSSGKKPAAAATPLAAPSTTPDAVPGSQPTAPAPVAEPAATGAVPAGETAS